MFKQFFQKAFAQFGLLPKAWWLYGLAGLLILLGQGLIFAQNITGGLIFSLAGVLALLLALAGEARLEGVYLSLRRASQNFLTQSETVARRWNQKGFALFKTGCVRQSAEVKEPASFPDTPLESAVVPALREPIILAVPKRAFIVVGLICLAASQLLLFAGYLAWGVSLAILAFPTLLWPILSRESHLTLGRLDVLLKTALIAVPGLGAVLVGNFLMLKNMELNIAKEITGYLLNLAGILLLIKLLPRIIPDPEPEAGNPLDRWTGEARSPWGLAAKVLLVLAAVLLFLFARQSGGFERVTLLVLAAIAALGLSFPWARQKTINAEPSLLAILGLRVLRLTALGVAIYLGFRGQTLIAQEQLYAGLFRFGAAAMALIIAFREPDPRVSDSLQEQPLKWYWEALGLILVLVAATWIRSRLLDIMPYGVECDEAGAGYHAVDIWKNQFQSITVHPSGRPLFMLLSKVAAFQFLGYENLGMRFMAMVWGVAGVLAVYLMSRLFYGPRIALAVAALLALSRWHIHFSRFGWSNTLMVLLLTIGFYFLIKGLVVRKKWHFVLAGASLSLSIQTETAARIIPIICAGLLAYFILSQKRFLQRNWKPMVALMLGVWLTGANLYLYWINKPHLLLRRVYEVSMFSEDANAPSNLWRGLVYSTKHSLTQLNWHGDYRTRHNGGLSGEPVLDFLTAILFALGFGMAIYYWRRLRYGLPIMLFFGFMFASIFSLEAPQSHRAFGVISAVFLMIGAFLDRTRRLLRESLGRLGVWAGALAFCILLLPIARTNYHKYFDAFPAFDTSCTAAARHMGKPAWQDAHHFVMSGHLWFGHPPFKLYARDVDAQFYYQPSEVVPIRRQGEQDALYTFILEYQPLLPVMQWYYPNGVYQEETHEKWGQQFQSWGVKHEEIMRTRGLTASYWKNSDWAGVPDFTRKDAGLDINFTSDTWPLADFGSVAWKGTVFIPHGGEYTLYAYGTDYLEVRIGSKVFLQAGNKQETRKRVWLAGGLHAFRARARVRQPGSRVLLEWSCHQEANYGLHGDPHQKAFSKQAVPTTYFFTYPEPIGLLETIYGNEKWEGKPLRQTVEPVPFFYWHGTPHGFTPPISADWRGQIKINHPGDYKFEIQHAGFMELEIAGQTVFHSGQPPDGREKRNPLSNPVYLEKGEYPIFMRWSTQNGWVMKLWWIPPGGERELVPAWILSPAAE